MRRRDLPDMTRLLKGVGYNVYQARGTSRQENGPWHAHVSGLRRGDLYGLAMRSAGISAEGIARRIDEKIDDLVANHGRDWRDARDEVLGSYASRYNITPNGDSGDWADVGFCGSEDEARERACEIIGHVFGRRLAAATAGFVPEPAVVPAIREGVFA